MRRFSTLALTAFCVFSGCVVRQNNEKGTEFTQNSKSDDLGEVQKWCGILEKRGREEFYMNFEDERGTREMETDEEAVATALDALDEGTKLCVSADWKSRKLVLVDRISQLSKP